MWLWWLGVLPWTVMLQPFMRGSREGSGPPPLKNHKNTGLLCNTGLDPMKNHKRYQASIKLGRHRFISETLSQQADDDTLIVVFESPLPSLKQQQKCGKKLLLLCQNFWIRACN